MAYLGESGYSLAPLLRLSLFMRNFCFSCYISLREPDAPEMLWLSCSPLHTGITGREVKAGEKFSLDAENDFV